MSKVDGPEVQQITYYRTVRPPTLKQFLIRKAVKEIASQTKGLGGVTTAGGRLLPSAAASMGDGMRGRTAEQIAQEHPEWVDEYEEKHGDNSSRE